ncbi:MAG: hypothetical protein J6W79_02550 [Alphaproteobacteria bacterium]|nr:hypothetical protein [Alphaproteobacteria bacterium]MBP5707853.1 hypothetical protein [Alphaproteobacteria bacterium]
MAKPLNEFLIEYFKLTRMFDMRDNHTEQWAYFEDLVTSGDMTKDMKKWADKLLQKDPAGNFIRVPAPNGEYQIISLPNPAGGTYDELNDQDWETLFRICQNTFFQMNQERDSFAENDKVIDFINEWQHVFTGTQQASLVATPATESQCTALATLLSGYGATLQPLLETDPNWSGILDSHTKYQDLIDGLNRKKYNKDDKFREKIQQLAGKINNACDPSTPGHANFINNIGGAKPNLRLIYDIYATGWIEPNIDPTKLTVFKEQYQFMFNTLYKEDKVLEAFKTSEGNDHRISAAVEGAKKSIDYHDVNSKNYVSPKRDDALTPMQQLQKWVKDTYEDCLEKYTTLRGDRVYFSENAKKIAKALDKAGIKPTDGVLGLCDGDKISKAVGTLKSSPTASAHFSWMKDTLKELSSDSDMKNTIAGALKNGTQMRNLVAEVMIKAVETNKIDEAKTTLEVLSVMKYGAVTSKVMDAFKQQEFSIFSDGKLSWNKAKGVQMVTNALDKSIKFAFMGIGYGVTIIGNEIHLLGSKFNNKFQHGKKDKTGKKLKQLSEAHDVYYAAQKLTFQSNKTAADAQDNANKATKQAERTTAIGTLGITATDPDAIKQEVENKARDIESVMKPDLANLANTLQPLQEQLDIYNTIHQLLIDKETFANDLRNLNTQLAGATTPAETRSINAQIDLLADRIDKNNQEINKYQQIVNIYGYSVAYPALANLDVLSAANMQTNVIDHFESSPTYLNALNAYNNKANEIYEHEQAIQQFRRAEIEIKNLDIAINKRQKIMDNWDKDHKNHYQELVAYWDMLETGRDSHTGVMYSWTPGSLKKKQKEFSANASTYISNFINNYGHVS